MRKTSRHKNKYGLKPMPPMLVIRGINPQMETKERAAIIAINAGQGTVDHYNLLQDVFNLLYVASEATGREYLRAFIPRYKAALSSMQLRYENFGKFGMNYDDRLALTDMINTSSYFWLKQPTEFYLVCDAEVRKFYKSVHVEA